MLHFKSLLSKNWFDLGNQNWLEMLLQQELFSLGNSKGIGLNSRSEVYKMLKLGPYCSPKVSKVFSRKKVILFDLCVSKKKPWFLSLSSCFRDYCDTRYCTEAWSLVGWATPWSLTPSPFYVVPDLISGCLIPTDFFYLDSLAADPQMLWVWSMEDTDRLSKSRSERWCQQTVE